MAKRALTVAEAKAMLESLADKVKEEGAELYQDIAAKLDELENAASDKAEAIAAEIGPKLEALKDKVEEEGREIIDAIEARVEMVKAEIAEELAELKEKGLVQWAKDNPMISGGIAIVIIGVIAIFVL